MSKFVSRFMKDESGATAIEYGLIVALATGCSRPSWRRTANSSCGTPTSPA